MEKVQAAQAKRDERERVKQEKAMQMEEKKKEREEKKKAKEAEKEQKALARQAKTKKGKGSKVNEEPRDAQDGGEACSPTPKTPKRPCPIPATPRQKTMVKRRREAVAAGVPAGASKAEGCGQDGKVKDVEKEEALAAKVKANHDLLKGVLEFGADVHTFPTLEANPTLKSFTVRPFGEEADKKNRDGGGKKSSIGVILFRSSFLRVQGKGSRRTPGNPHSERGHRRSEKRWWGRLQLGVDKVQGCQTSVSQLILFVMFLHKCPAYMSTVLLPVNLLPFVSGILVSVFAWS